MTGATIGGRLLLNGVKVEGPVVDTPKRKSLSANGSTIRGGIFTDVTNASKPADSTNYPTEFIGDVRLRNANLDGPAIFSGVNMTAGSTGIAMWASNTRFGSDLIFNPAGTSQQQEDNSQGDNQQITGVQPQIHGELRFRGVRVRGHLWLQGLNIQAGVTGVALDCFTAEVDKTVALGSYCPTRVQRKGSTVQSTIQGLVSLAHLHAQYLTIGASPIAEIDSQEDRLTLTGTILMNQIKLQAAALFANVLIRPGEEIASATQNDIVLKQLKRWGVYRPYCVVHASYATLGSRLFVRLAEGSHGLVNLYGASTGTIGAYSGSADVGEDMDSKRPSWPELWKAWWGLGPNKEPQPNKLREYWGGPEGLQISSRNRGGPQSHEVAKRTILVNIDEFTYTRTNDLWERTPDKACDLLSVLHWLAGRPTPGQLGSRYQFVQRIIENPGSSEPVVISAHRQLAKVYRDMGYLSLSYRYIRERRWLQLRFGNLGVVQSIVDRLYSTFFGFGYSPTRAIATLLLLFVASFMFVQIGLQANDPKQAVLPDLKCRGAFCSPLPKGDAKDAITGCHLTDPLTDPGDSKPTVWQEGGEAAKIIFPFTRLETNSVCALRADAGPGLHFALSLIHGLSWVLFPFAAATLTGVLRENHTSS